MPNRLASQSSPYLLQHAENPVDWRPWDEEALQLAVAEDKPIFLSIGYSACHWCHVMEHESFESQEIADQLNAGFVCIKVDREERPDLDQIYMNAVQLMTGRGGWPMSVFLTPDLKPFFAGTYWPPRRRAGMPGFDEVVAAVLEAWRNRRDAATSQADEIVRRIQQIGSGDSVDLSASATHLSNAVDALKQVFDHRNGGFGQSPKFPHPMDLQVLLRHWRRTGDEEALAMVRLNLDRMAAGGIYDHLGGGFARYSVDERWLVPHFEKMLYDNALLVEVYVDAFLATREPGYAQTARETLDYVLRDMTDEQGGFHSTEDADSEGEEGKFYVWSVEQVQDALGELRGGQFCAAYDITQAGNFEGKNIPNLLRGSLAEFAAARNLDLDRLVQQLADDRATLFQLRNERIRPGKDDKILASWNGLMIQTMARASMAFDEPKYRDAAVHAAEFIWSNMRREDGRLLHAFRNGAARFDAYLEDYAYLANALITLYEATVDEVWIERAVELAEQMVNHFRDVSGEGFFFTADDHETLIARNKDVHDASVPSSSAMAATALFRLGRLTGEGRWLDAAESGVRSAGDLFTRAPAAAGQFLIALDMMLGPFEEVVLVAESADQLTQLLSTARNAYRPNRVLAARPAEGERRANALDAAFDGRDVVSGEATLYLCENQTCRQPLTGLEAIEALRGD